MRRVIVALVAVALAVAVFVLWPRSSGDGTSSTEALATSTTTTTTTTSATTTAGEVSTTQPAPTTTTVDESRVVDSVEEAEAILRDHYFTWFLGIFEEKTEEIQKSVILQSQVEAAVAQFGQMEFDEPPSPEGLTFDQTDILQANQECLSVWTVISSTFREGSSAGVVVFRWQDARWKFLSSWASRDDLWEADCESSL